MVSPSKALVAVSTRLSQSRPELASGRGREGLLRARLEPADDAVNRKPASEVARGDSLRVTQSGGQYYG